MCFSAPASFIASGGLIVAGGASFALAKKEEKILAAIPFLFGIQQGLEGMQWLYLNNGTLSLFAGYGFLFFAFIVWPIYVPVFVYVLDKKRRKLLKRYIFLGVAVALYFLILLSTEPLTIYKLNTCINYNLFYPFKSIAAIAYILAIFWPLFTSNIKFFRWFGITTAILAVFSWYFYTVNFVSIWCFFSAIVSSMFLIYVKFKKSI